MNQLLKYILTAVGVLLLSLVIFFSGLIHPAILMISSIIVIILISAIYQYKNPTWKEFAKSLIILLPYICLIAFIVSFLTIKSDLYDPLTMGPSLVIILFLASLVVIIVLASIINSIILLIKKYFKTRP
jgi:glucan phosphoethanolaminetransferase (alkaline phosphatase superfamily)